MFRFVAAPDRPGVRILLPGLLFLSLAPAQTPPGWLVPYPGAEEARTAYPSRIEGVYSTSASQEQVTAHYSAAFSQAGVPLSISQDGMGGQVLKASVPGCDLLIQIRGGRAEGTPVVVNCSAKAAPALATRAPASVVPGMAGPGMRRSQVTGAAVRTRPVDNDDAPPLAWPSWLNHADGTPVAPKAEIDNNTHDSLVAVYKTNIGMSRLHEHYTSLLKTYGGGSTPSRLHAGSTASGVRQNSSGSVRGMICSAGPSGPCLSISALYHRFYVDEPITVTLRVSAMPSLRRRSW